MSSDLWSDWALDCHSLAQGLSGQTRVMLEGLEGRQNGGKQRRQRPAMPLNESCSNRQQPGRGSLVNVGSEGGQTAVRIRQIQDQIRTAGLRSASIVIYFMFPPGTGARMFSQCLSGFFLLQTRSLSCCHFTFLAHFSKPV